MYYIGFLVYTSFSQLIPIHLTLPRVCHNHVRVLVRTDCMHTTIRAPNRGNVYISRIIWYIFTCPTVSLAAELAWLDLLMCISVSTCMQAHTAYCSAPFARGEEK